MESTHPFSVSFAPCFQAVLCRLQLFFRMFLDKLFQICADRFIMKQKRRCFSPFLLSPSLRRAWIEIRQSSGPSFPRSVALLAEGVDRNCRAMPCALSPLVALLAEGVDRNSAVASFAVVDSRSPSLRRAWIEIQGLQAPCRRCCVALLAEGVDRNVGLPLLGDVAGASPSLRRAWIEILCLRLRRSLRPGRPPCGGRG